MNKILYTEFYLIAVLFNLDWFINKYRTGINEKQSSTLYFTRIEDVQIFDLWTVERRFTPSYRLYSLTRV